MRGRQRIRWLVRASETVPLDVPWVVVGHALCADVAEPTTEFQSFQRAELGPTAEQNPPGGSYGMG